MSHLTAIFVAAVAVGQVSALSFPFNSQGHIARVGVKPTQRWQPVIRCQTCQKHTRPLKTSGCLAQSMKTASSSPYIAAIDCHIWESKPQFIPRLSFHQACVTRESMTLCNKSLSSLNSFLFANRWYKIRSHYLCTGLTEHLMAKNIIPLSLTRCCLAQCYYFCWLHSTVDAIRDHRFSCLIILIYSI